LTIKAGIGGSRHDGAIFDDSGLASGNSTTLDTRNIDHIFVWFNEQWLSRSRLCIVTCFLESILNIKIENEFWIIHNDLVASILLV
jgi:hypothetical protein